jgi:hypothetical protein
MLSLAGKLPVLFRVPAGVPGTGRSVEWSTPLCGLLNLCLGLTRHLKRCLMFLLLLAILSARVVGLGVADVSVV